METFFFHQDIIIITANAAGEKYLIKAKSIQIMILYLLPLSIGESSPLFIQQKTEH